MWEFTERNELIHTGCRARRYITSLCEDGNWHCLGCYASPPELIQLAAQWKKCRCAHFQTTENTLTRICTNRVIWELEGR